jgi:uroporphyrinogen-III synthase
MAGFNGMRVLSFESRRAKEIAQLIANNGGQPVVAPSTREIATPNEDEQKLIQGILNGDFDAIIFMTGVGARALVAAADATSSRDQFLESLRNVPVIVRGPKPAAVMREFNIPVALNAPEPNTWREIVKALDANAATVSLKNRRVAIQEHGEASPELYAALRERGADIFAARVYRWELPEDIAPLQNAIRSLLKSEIEVVLFTSSVQYVHAAKVAAEMGLAQEFNSALNRAMVASIGPVASEALRKNGIRVDLEPSHPKMGFLVKEAAERGAELVPRKAASPDA